MRGSASSPGPRRPRSTRWVSPRVSGSRSSRTTAARLLDLVLRGLRVRAGAGPDQLPTGADEIALHRRALRRGGAARRSRARRSARRRRRAEHTLRARRRERRRSCYRLGADPTPWDADEDATATINYTSGTTARPEGRAADPPQPLGQRHHVRLAHRRHRPRRLPAHAADVPLQRLGHAVRASPGWARRHVVLRKVDGAEILRRVERARRHADVRGAGGGELRPRRGRGRGTARSPGRGRCASSWPARRRPRRRSSGSRPSWAGSSCRSTG